MLDTSGMRFLPGFWTFTMHLDNKSKDLDGGRAACMVSATHSPLALTWPRIPPSDR
jgi:hypothetical protein